MLAQDWIGRFDPHPLLKVSDPILTLDWIESHGIAQTRLGLLDGPVWSRGLAKVERERNPRNAMSMVRVIQV